MTDGQGLAQRPGLGTVFVTMADAGYLSRARRTICDLRTVGRWRGPIVLVALDDKTPVDPGVLVVRFPRVDTSYLVEQLGQGFSDGDGRELSKLLQWEKLHLFDAYWWQWDRVVFLDAGLRVLDDVCTVMDALPPCNEIVGFWAPNDRGDGPVKQNKGFAGQLSDDKPELKARCLSEFGIGTGEDVDYFLNCMWIYDTALRVDKAELIACMNAWPICRTNEMGVMNLVLKEMWRAFPHMVDGKALFEWCELNWPGTTWRDYRFVKYSSTLLLNADPV